MYSTYHFSSAQDINISILEAIKAVYLSNPITITVEDNGNFNELTPQMKRILDERLLEDDSTYLTAEQSINQLNKRYGLCS